MKRRNPLKVLGRNHAEKVIARLNVGAVSCAGVGLAWLIIAMVFDRVDIIHHAMVYLSMLSGVGAVLCLHGSVSTAASNALFRDRDEVLASIRILENERREQRSKRDGSLSQPRAGHRPVHSTP